MLGEMFMEDGEDPALLYQIQKATNCASYLDLPPMKRNETGLSGLENK